MKIQNLIVNHESQPVKSTLILFNKAVKKTE